MNISQGSIEECRDYIILSKDLGYVSAQEFSDLFTSIEESSKVLYLYCKGIINNNGIKD